MSAILLSILLSSSSFATKTVRPAIFRAGNENVHVVYASDDEQLLYTLTSAKTVIEHSSDPKRVFIHIFHRPSSESSLRSAVDCYFPLHTRQAKIMLHSAQENDVNIDFLVRSKSDQRLANVFNFLRIYLYRLLPDVEKVLYLDIDTVVLGDVSTLFHAHLRDGTDKFIAVARRDTTLERMINFRNPIVQRHNISPDGMSFNAGVMLMHLGNWRASKIVENVEFWSRLNVETDVYKHGSQPPLLLAFADDDRHEEFDGRWNLDGLGWRIRKPREIQTAGILHWTGPDKPWLKTGRYQEFWKPFINESCDAKFAPQLQHEHA